MDSRPSPPVPRARRAAVGLAAGGAVWCGAVPATALAGPPDLLLVLRALDDLRALVAVLFAEILVVVF
jgi:hypothetical protein